MFYQITATVVHKRDNSSVTHQIPTFFLHQDVQGIVSSQQMGRIVNDILNPFNLPDITISWNCLPNVEMSNS